MYEEYRQAQAAWRTACRTHSEEREQRTSEALLRSRVRLYLALVQDGWEAPLHVRAVLERDSALVAFEERTADDLECLVAVAAAA